MRQKGTKGQMDSEKNKEDSISENQRNREKKEIKRGKEREGWTEGQKDRETDKEDRTVKVLKGQSF